MKRQTSTVDAGQQRGALLQAFADGDDWAIARSPAHLRDDDDYVLDEARMEAPAAGNRLSGSSGTA